MIYSFQLLPHANIRYRQVQDELNRKELACMLEAVGVSSRPYPEHFGNCTFLSMESEELSDSVLQFLAGHSCLLLMFTRNGHAFSPLPFQAASFMGPDLPEILKYKGKTNPAFTRMMINCALSAARLLPSERVRVLDPVCGRGTTLYVSLCMGMHCAGIESRSGETAEADRYLQRYCTTLRLKFRRRAFSETVGGRGCPGVEYELAPDTERFRQGDVRVLQLFTADSLLSPALLKKRPPDLIIADLPYGVQHAPTHQGSLSDFQEMLSSVLPAWAQTLKAGGTMALSFNLFTLPRHRVISALKDAGMTPLETPLYASFAHEVEQAVRRDFVVALKT